MGNIIRPAQVNIIRSTQPEPLVDMRGQPLSMGYSSKGATYNPHKSYPLVLKGCPDIVRAPTNPYPGPCPPPPWTNSGWYFNYPAGYSFCWHCQPGEFWHGHPDCLCCPSIIGGGSESVLYQNSVNAKILRGELNLPDFTDQNAYPGGDPEDHLYGDIPKFSKVGGGGPCKVYSKADVWYRYLENSSGNIINPNNPIPDCYPLTHPGAGCPVAVGQCFRWNTGEPTCVVERLLDFPNNRPKIQRNNYPCSTCDDPVAPPYTPNSTAVHSPWYGGNPVPPDPYPVNMNPTQSMCTDCTERWNGNFHCLHPDDPIYGTPSTCVELSAGTIVYIYNPGPNQTYHAINAPHNYQLANNTIQGTLVGCELTCIGGCTTQFSAGTAACNYSPSAAFDDGSCCFNFPCTGCNDPTATNYCPTCCSFNSNLCLYPGEGCTDDNVGTFLDINGNPTCGPLANQPCQYCNYDPAAYIPKPCCDISGCMDSTCATGGGGYPSVTGFYDCGPMNNMGYLYPNYDPNACCEGLCCTDVGCTDPTALNYDPLACWDDGSCLYPLGGCMDDGSAANAAPNRPVGWIGQACNYWWLVTFDDGSCLYGACQEPTAINYLPLGPLATADCSCNPNGTSIWCCDFIVGCLDDGLQPNSTYPGTAAYNFNPLAQGCLNSNNIPDPTIYDCCLYPTFDCNIGSNSHQQVIGLDSVMCGSNKTFIPPETFGPHYPYGVTWPGDALTYVATNHPYTPFSEFYYLDYWNTGPGYGGTTGGVTPVTCMSAVTNNWTVPSFTGATPGIAYYPCPPPVLGPGPGVATCLKRFTTLVYLEFDNTVYGSYAGNSLYTWSMPPINNLITINSNPVPQNPATLTGWHVNHSTQTWEEIINHVCNAYMDYWDIGNRLYRMDAGGCLACPPNLTPAQYANMGCQDDPTCGKLAQKCPSSVWSNTTGPCKKPKCCCEIDTYNGGCLANTTISLIMNTNPCECPPHMLEVSCHDSQPIRPCPFGIHHSPREVLCIMSATDPAFMDKVAFNNYILQYSTPPPGRWTTPNIWVPRHMGCDCVTEFEPVSCTTQNNQDGFVSQTDCEENCYAGCTDPIANNYDATSTIPCGPQDGSGIWQNDNDCCTYDQGWNCHPNGTTCYSPIIWNGYNMINGPGAYSSQAACNAAVAANNCLPAPAIPIVGPAQSPQMRITNSELEPGLLDINYGGNTINRNPSTPGGIYNPNTSSGGGISNPPGDLDGRPSMDDIDSDDDRGTDGKNPGGVRDI